MSYNNYQDGDAAYGAACDFPDPTCVVVKHTNPCGVASRGDLLEAYRLAVRADPISAFGGIVAFNRRAPHRIPALARPLCIIDMYNWVQVGQGRRWRSSKQLASPAASLAASPATVHMHAITQSRAA